MKKYQNAKLKLFLVSLSALILITGLPLTIAIVCKPLVGEMFAYLIAGGVAIIFGAVMFNNTEVRNVYEKYKSIKKFYNPKIYSTSKTDEFKTQKDTALKNVV